MIWHLYICKHPDTSKHYTFTSLALKDRAEKKREEARLDDQRFKALHYERDRASAESNAEEFGDGLMGLGLGVASNPREWLSNLDELMEKQNKRRAAKKPAEL